MLIIVIAQFAKIIYAVMRSVFIFNKATTAQLIGLKSSLEAEVSSLKSILDIKTRRIEELEEMVENQELCIKQLNGKIIDGESARRKLHNLVLELKVRHVFSL